MKIKIFHNISRDASFGLNRVIGASTADQRHRLVWVFEYEDDAGYTPAATLARAFDEFNIGDGELAKRYRARRLRSLSVGDVVMIDGQAYSCESVGWKERLPGELRILPAAEADKAIRELYDMEPAEPLSVTVPLPD